jgi:nucleoside-diphosphate-sugar epimerase
MKKTVLITGGSGYIGSWITKYLLEAGHIVRLTVRDKNKLEKIAHLKAVQEQQAGQLEIWEADLLKEGSFDEAARGADVLMHVASPFILKVKDAQKDLVDPAQKGTLNVLRAASQSGTIKKVILTSSVVSIFGDAKDMADQNLKEFTEEQWNTTSSLEHQPYSYSKTLAEKAAWDLYATQKQWKLIAINPAFVMGPPLGKNSDSESILFMKRMLTGAYKTGAAPFYFGFVDVRDVAKAHILAMEERVQEGRHITVKSTHSMLELANTIESEFNQQFKLPTSTTPTLLLYILGWAFGLSWKYIRRNAGYPIVYNTTRSRENLGLIYRPFSETIRDMVHAMQERNIV